MATIYDVAKASGVSLATVSNVINNGSRPVRPETRQRILDAIERLDYHPSAVARGLARQRTRTIGILFGVVESSAIVINAYSAAILQAVLAEAAETGYDVTHLTAPWRGAAESLRAFRDGRTDGNVIVAPPFDSDILPALVSLGLPLVAVSAPPSGVPSVDVDDAAGARLAMGHLLSLGHRRIAHICGPLNLPSALVRREGYALALREAGIALQEEYLVPGSYRPEEGYAATRRLLALPEPPTAIFAANDEIALGVLEAAREMGVSIPGRLSLVGVDDRPVSALLTPPLTTVRQPFEEIGRRATRLLVEAIGGASPAATAELFLPHLVVRGSTTVAPL